MISYQCIYYTFINIYILHTKYLYLTTGLFYYTTVLYIDIDECLTGTSGCEQLCQNTPGSFKCTCFLGYAMNSDNRSCVKTGTVKHAYSDHANDQLTLLKSNFPSLWVLNKL